MGADALAHKTLWIPLADNCRRRSHRWPLHARVMLLAPVRAEGVALNASADGARIAVNCALHAGERVMLRVSFESGYKRVLEGTVVWTKTASDGTIAGVALPRAHDS
jgi:hypothetical protein